MPRFFKKNPELTYVQLPGYGRLSGDTVVQGDQYAAYAPALLQEVDEASVTLPDSPRAKAAVTIPLPTDLVPPAQVAKPVVASTEAASEPGKEPEVIPPPPPTAPLPSPPAPPPVSEPSATPSEIPTEPPIDPAPKPKTQAQSKRQR